MVRTTLPREREGGASFSCKAKDGEANFDRIREDALDKESLTTEREIWLWGGAVRRSTS